MKTLNFRIVMLAAGFLMIVASFGQSNDSIIAEKAYKALKKADVINSVSMSFGLASNVEMAAIGGFPLEVDDGVNPALNLTHMALAVPRSITSLFVPIQVAKARKITKSWRESSEMAASCQKLFANLDAAQVLSSAAPVLCISGGIMMFAASTSPDYETGQRTERPGLKAAGWALVGAGLAATIASDVLINISKRELNNKICSFKITAGSSGIGVQYNLPNQH